MNHPTAVALLAAGVLAVPAAATGRAIPSKHHVRPATAAVGHGVTPRVLCICVTGAAMQPPETDAQFEAEIDQALIAHGLDPIYSTAPSTPSG
jgi:hypothetical protein